MKDSGRVGKLERPVRMEMESCYEHRKAWKRRGSCGLRNGFPVSSDFGKDFSDTEEQSASKKQQAQRRKDCQISDAKGRGDISIKSAIQRSATQPIIDRLGPTRLSCQKRTSASHRPTAALFDIPKLTSKAACCDNELHHYHHNDEDQYLWASITLSSDMFSILTR